MGVLYSSFAISHKMSLLKECRIRPRGGKGFLIYSFVLCIVPFTLWFTYDKNLEIVNHFKQLSIVESFESDHSQRFKFSDVGKNVTLKTPVLITTSRSSQEKIKNKVKKPVILMWSTFYRKKLKTVTPGIQDPNCCIEAEVTFDRARLNESVAVVIYHWFQDLNSDDLPPSRTPYQLWVLFSEESSCRTPDLSKFDNLFNLTMTFRHDSDIFAPYGYTKSLDKPLTADEDILINKVPLNSLIRGRNKLFAGAISHCNASSKRDEFAEAIKEYLDIYGACGKPVCPFTANRSVCNPNEVFEKISKEYKFYFAAENEFSQDYITEKFWRTFRYGVVPVVYGGGNYSAVAPPKSYIDSRDFNSPHDLVQFLVKLSNDTDEYKKYFEWRRNFTVYNTNGWHGWCDLCKYIKNYVIKTDSRPEAKFYKELNKWWTTKPILETSKIESSCWGPFWLQGL